MSDGEGLWRDSGALPVRSREGKWRVWISTWLEVWGGAGVSMCGGMGVVSAGDTGRDLIASVVLGSCLFPSLMSPRMLCEWVVGCGLLIAEEGPQVDGLLAAAAT